jgi:hypothetical protein
VHALPLPHQASSRTSGSSAMSLSDIIDGDMEGDRSRRLWCAVILQALDDAVSQGQDTESRESARKWLTNPSKDFDRACHLAGLEPCRVRTSAKAKIADADAGTPSVKAPRKPSCRPKTYEYDGQSLTILEWSERSGVNSQTLAWRLAQGWPMARALIKPSRGVVKDFHKSFGDRRPRAPQDCTEIEFFHTTESTSCP